MRAAVAALMFCGCAPAEVRVNRPEPCYCVLPCGGGAVASSSPTRQVHGVALYDSLVKRLEERWGKPLEETFPPAVISPADDYALSRWFDGIEQPVLAELRFSLDRERTSQREAVEHARVVWLDALAGKSLVPPLEAKLVLDASIDDATDAVASLVREQAPPSFIARSSAFKFQMSVDLDTEKLAEGTLVEPIVLREVSRARLAELAKKSIAAYAQERADKLADRVATEERPRWAWARKKP
ncbi:MAG: hypothetical protein ACXVEF_31795 [Polyangiales bacterium]